MILSNLPPGCSGGTEPADPVKFYCYNEQCDSFEETWEAPATREMGMVVLVNEDTAFCPKCGQEGEEEK